MHKEHTSIILFDGCCNLCNYMVHFILKRGVHEKFKFASLQSEGGQLVLNKFSLPFQDFNSFVLIQGDKIFLKSTATLTILKELGGIWKVFYLFIILPEPIRDFMYSIIAKNRNKLFGKRETCMVPASNLKDRFIE